MAQGTTQVADMIVPEQFTPYIQQLTKERNDLVQAGVLVSNDMLNEKLAGGGLTFNVPSFQDLDASEATGADNVSTDAQSDLVVADFNAGTPNPRNDSTPDNVGTAQEIASRLSRNKSWSVTNLAATLAGADPLVSIFNRVAKYWSRRMQRTFIAVWNGVIADNDLAPGGSEHVQFDLTNDVSNAGVFVPGVTNFTAENVINTTALLGDAMDDLSVLLMHSTVFATAQKNNLIDFIPDARGEVNIATFQGKRVVKDDMMPRTGNVYDTWLFTLGACLLGDTAPDDATEMERKPSAGNGGGETLLHNRQQWSFHPVGHAYVQGAIPDGGPSNANLAAAANWLRVYPERKQIGFARLVTTEA